MAEELVIRKIIGYYHEDKLYNLLKHKKQTNIFIFIETKPSTSYNLGHVFVEDIRTGDWYPFSTEVAFQNEGGGWNNTRDLLFTYKKLLEEGIDSQVILKVAQSDDLKKVMDREITFSDLKARSIPANIIQNDLFNEFYYRFERELISIMKMKKDKAGCYVNED